MRRSFESMLPLQAVRIDIRADCAVEILHSFPFTLGYHLPCFVNNRVPARAFFEGNQDIGSGHGNHEFPWIYLDRNSLAHAGAIVRYRNGFPARTSNGTDSALEKSRRMNPPEMRVLDGEEFGCTRNVSEIHRAFYRNEQPLVIQVGNDDPGLVREFRPYPQPHAARMSRCGLQSHHVHASIQSNVAIDRNV